MPVKTSPFHLYAAGLGYVEAAKMIFVSPHYPSKKDQVLLPISALLGFSSEFFLKAWLMQNGLPEDEVSKQKIRHNLQGLYALAVSRGLSGEHPRTRELFDAIGEHHSKHEFRYLPAEGEITKVDFPICFEVIDTLDGVVRNAVDADAKAAAINAGIGN